MSSTSTTMQAWVCKKSGDPTKVLQLETSWPRPVPSATQVLVKVHAVSLNPVGWKTMSQWPINLTARKPLIPEADVAGVVAEGGSSAYKAGDEVFGIVPYDGILKTGQGVMAEYAVVEAELLARKPKNLSFEEACSFPLAGLTAWQALTVNGGLKEGDGKRVFINGGSGGVGAYAIQIAKAYGAYVVSTTSPSSNALTSTLGADELIDYRSVDLPKQLAKRFGTSETKFDIIFDTVGVQAVYAGAPNYLKPSGPYVDIAGPHLDGSFRAVLSAALDLSSRFLLPSFLGGKQVKYIFTMLSPSKIPKLSEAADLFSKGTLKPFVDEVFAFSDVHKAYERSMSGRAKGKVVVKVI